MTSGRNNRLDFLEEPSPLLINSAYQSDQPGSSIRPPPYIPGDGPPSYTVSEKRFRIILCEVCDTEIRILKNDDRLIASCKSCGEETPVGPPPQGQMFVRCPCSCLITCNSDLVWVQCPRPGCSEVIRLSPPKDHAPATPTAPPKTSSSYGTILPNTYQTQPSSADSSARRPTEARQNTRLLQSRNSSATERQTDVPGTSGSVRNVEQPRMRRTVNCDVCTVLITVSDESKSVVVCPTCNEGTAIGPPPPGKKFLRCSCNCLLIHDASFQKVRCCRKSCGKVTTVSVGSVPSAAPPVGDYCTGCSRPFQRTSGNGVCELIFWLLLMMVIKIATVVVVMTVAAENKLHVLWINVSFPLMLVRIIRITRTNANR